MKNKRDNLLTFFEDSMVFLTLYCVALLPLTLSSVLYNTVATTIYFRGFILFGFVAISELIRSKLKNFFTFTITHFCLLGFSVLVSKTVLEATVYIVLSLFIIGYSFKRYIAENKHTYSLNLFIGAITIYFIVNIISSYVGYETPKPFLYAFTIVHILVYMLYTHIKNLDYQLDIVLKNSIQPVYKIKNFNNKIIAIAMILSLVVLISLPYLHVQDLFKGIGNLLFIVLSFFAKRITGKVGSENSEYYDMVDKNSDNYFEDLGVNEQSELFKLIENILIYTVNILIFAGIVFAICLLIYKLYKNFNKVKKSDNEVIESISPIIRSESSIFNFKKLTNIFLATTVNEKIRKLYYKNVKGYIKNGIDIDSSNTTKEINKKVNENLSQDINTLTTIYEKARYSRSGCNKKDLSDVKESLK